MALRLDGGTNTNYLDYSLGNIGDCAFGTIAAVVFPGESPLATQVILSVNDETNINFGIGLTSGMQACMIQEGTSVVPTGMPTLDGTSWHLIAYTKASGTAVRRGHDYNFVTRQWTHTDSTSTAANFDTTSTVMRFAIGVGLSEAYHGELAGAAIWKDLVLTDQQIESLATSWTNWYKTGPSGFWIFNRPTGTPYSTPDLIGGGAGATFSSATGTGFGTSVNSDPLGWGRLPKVVDFNLGALFTQSLTGVLAAGNAAGTITKRTNKTLSGSPGGLLGALSKRTAKALAGVVSTLSGTLTPLRLTPILKSLAGSITMSGTLATQVAHLYQVLLAGSISLSGTLVSGILQPFRYYLGTSVKALRAVSSTRALAAIRKLKP